VVTSTNNLLEFERFGFGWRSLAGRLPGDGILYIAVNSFFSVVMGYIYSEKKKKMLENVIKNRNFLKSTKKLKNF
jgi:hypothetical protein